MLKHFVIMMLRTSRRLAEHRLIKISKPHTHKKKKLINCVA